MPMLTASDVARGICGRRRGGTPLTFVAGSAAVGEATEFCCCPPLDGRRRVRARPLAVGDPTPKPFAEDGGAEGCGSGGGVFLFVTTPLPPTAVTRRRGIGCSLLPLRSNPSLPPSLVVLPPPSLPLRPRLLLRRRLRPLPWPLPLPLLLVVLLDGAELFRLLWCARIRLTKPPPPPLTRTEDDWAGETEVEVEASEATPRTIGWEEAGEGLPPPRPLKDRDDAAPGGG